MSVWDFTPRIGSVLAIVDHASNDIPADIDLGIDPELLETHIAWDIGAASLAEALGYAVFQAKFSRLVVDLNRNPGDDGVVPRTSDGIVIPGNYCSIPARIERFWHPYHLALAGVIADRRPSLLLSVHSFTPNLGSTPDDKRAWEIGVLYNNDDRAARIAIPLLNAKDVNTGDQLPYSGKDLNATMNRHGEGTGTPYLGIEVRQDLIDTPDGVMRWARILLPIIKKCASELSAYDGAQPF